jgi:hypothetical protein
VRRYIGAADDIERADKGVYSPTLRNVAQDARNTLFNMLATVPGLEAYAAIKTFERAHPEPDVSGDDGLGRKRASDDEPSHRVEF